MFERCGAFSSGLASVRTDYEWAYVDQTGKFQIKPQFDEATAFSEGLAAVAQRGYWGYIKADGKFAIKPQFRSFSRRPAALRFSEGKACVRQGDKWGFIGPAGNFTIAPKFDRGGTFREGLAQVCDSASRCGYIDGSGKYVWSAEP
jgi:hypothetical protein